MTKEKEKKRLSLTANKMPEAVYAKLEKLGSERKLTPFIVNLVEKEERMDKLIEDLSVVLDKVSSVEKLMLSINNKLDGSTVPSLSVKKEENDPIYLTDPETIQEGKLDISGNIEGGIEEEIEEIDF